MVGGGAASNTFAQDEVASQPTSMPTTAPAAEKPYDGPTLRVANLTEVFKLSIEKGFLSLDTKLEPTERPTRVMSPGLPLHGEVNVVANDMQAPAADGRAPLRMLRFTTPPDGNVETIVKTSVAAMPNGLHIDQFSEIAGMMRGVQFIQQIPVVFEPGDMDANTEEPRVRLHVNINYTDDSDRQPIRQLYTADSFTELRQNHAREVSMYLTPLLLQLQQDDVVAPEMAAAKRALPTGPTTAPAGDVRDKVASLIEKLSVPDQAARAEAFRELQSMGETGLAAISSVDRSKLSAEQNSLLDLLVTDETGVPTANATDLLNDPFFLVDSLSLSDAALRLAAFEQLKKLTSMNDLSFDADGSDSTRRAQAMNVRAKVDAWVATNQPRE